MREYVVKPEFGVDHYLAIYEREGYALQAQVLGSPLGHFVTEVGELNKLVALWQYDSMAQRDERRRELAGLAQWQQFVAKVTPLLSSMTNSILRPVSLRPPAPSD